jgi:hypothetical protein
MKYFEIQDVVQTVEQQIPPLRFAPVVMTHHEGRTLD